MLLLWRDMRISLCYARWKKKSRFTTQPLLTPWAGVVPVTAGPGYKFRFLAYHAGWEEHLVTVPQVTSMTPWAEGLVNARSWSKIPASQ